MFWSKKKEGASEVSMGQMLSIVASMLALCIAIGAARWSWAAVEEQIALRKDYNELRNQQDQLKIQFDYWDEKVTNERVQMKKMRGEMTAPTP